MIAAVRVVAKATIGWGTRHFESAGKLTAVGGITVGKLVSYFAVAWSITDLVPRIFAWLRLTAVPELDPPSSTRR